MHTVTTTATAREIVDSLVDSALSTDDDVQRKMALMEVTRELKRGLERVKVEGFGLDPTT